MSTPASSMPDAIRHRISAPAKARVWTPENFADVGPRTAVDKALHRLVASRSLRRCTRLLRHPQEQPAHWKAHLLPTRAT